MKIAISSTGENLDSNIDSRFGRCAYFIIVDTDTMNYECYPNEGSGFSSGAGTSAAQFIASKGVEYVITGNCGPKAMQVLNSAGVKLILGQSGSIREAVERFKRGELTPSDTTALGTGWGTGRGGGRGMGMGRGGMGRGYGRGLYFPQQGQFANEPSGNLNNQKGEDVSSLKQEINDLKKGLNLILERLEKLEKK